MRAPIPVLAPPPRMFRPVPAACWAGRETTVAGSACHGRMPASVANPGSPWEMPCLIVPSDSSGRVASGRPDSRRPKRPRRDLTPEVNAWKSIDVMLSAIVRGPCPRAPIVIGAVEEARCVIVSTVDGVGSGSIPRERDWTVALPGDDTDGSAPPGPRREEPRTTPGSNVASMTLSPGARPIVSKPVSGLRRTVSVRVPLSPTHRATFPPPSDGFGTRVRAVRCGTVAGSKNSPARPGWETPSLAVDRAGPVCAGWFLKSPCHRSNWRASAACSAWVARCCSLLRRTPARPVGLS